MASFNLLLSGVLWIYGRFFCINVFNAFLMFDTCYFESNNNETQAKTVH